MHIVYILYSPKHDKYYVGQTPDMGKRLVYHNELGTGFTSKCRPWELKKAFQVENASVAARAERYIKGKKSRRFVEQLVVEEGLWQYVLGEIQAG